MVCHKTIFDTKFEKIFERGGGGGGSKYKIFPKSILLTHYSKITATNVAAHFQSRI